MYYIVIFGSIIVINFQSTDQNRATRPIRLLKSNEETTQLASYFVELDTQRCVSFEGRGLCHGRNSPKLSLGELGADTYGCFRSPQILCGWKFGFYLLGAFIYSTYMRRPKMLLRRCNLQPPVEH